ncbi:sensor histidine kinase [Ideonella azotifigens]|uniref:histidine kinase n=2 Tax=Ideonella azotifigens TaxID=513160 RepID=A0ABN1K8M5_9BURK|nr:sensor histidine kinase [Ideonella azotifigens]MCD2342988.1 sensor histidine kinase [Ideonella azotifigens]
MNADPGLPPGPTPVPAGLPDPLPPGRWQPLSHRLLGKGLGALHGARSLRQQLLVWVLLPQLVLWLAGAFFTYNLAARYANAAIDASLLQATRALARQVKPVGNGLLIDFPRAAQDILEADPNDRVLYTVSSPPGQFILGNRNLPMPPTAGDAGAAPGDPRFYDGQIQLNPHLEQGEKPIFEQVRVAALYLSYGDDIGPSQTMLVQVARSSTNREELARRILLDTVLPLSVLIIAMTMIVWAGIGAGLAPLSKLRSQVVGRAANDLTPIQIDVAPHEVRALAQAINALLAAVQRNVGAQKRFISDAAHQLRTPLAGLKSQTELALKDATEPALQARLQRVHESATRSAHLVNQLLTLARAEPESATRQSQERVDMAKLARELTAELVPRALHAGQDLGFAVADEAEPLHVRGTSLLLREALINVIDNALRYAGRGAEVTVLVAAEGDDWVRIEVNDNGPGLPLEQQHQVFERFFRATHEGTGCGLGLAIVKEIVERHAGRVSVQSVHPTGLSVQLRLPRSH